MMRGRREYFSLRGWFALAALALLLVACSDMSNQPKVDPLEASAFFPDHRSARPLVPGTVARHQDPLVEAELEARDENGELVREIPIEVTLEVLQRGQERYDIFCAPCHGLDGYGQGMIVQRGFPPPPSFHLDRLRDAPDGHYYEVITQGFGVMFPYDYRVKPLDRWAITAYIRALQLSQDAPSEAVPPEALEQLEEEQP